MAKLKDVVATVGTYEKDGQKKYLTRRVGSIIETKHGERLLLDASFNPAGCERNPDGSVWLALFDPRKDDQKQSQPQAAPQGGGDSFDDDVPF